MSAGRSGDANKLNLAVEMHEKTRAMTIKYTGTRVGDCPR
jgi:hypothetical protein